MHYIIHVFTPAPCSLMEGSELVSGKNHRGDSLADNKLDMKTLGPEFDIKNT